MKRNQFCIFALILALAFGIAMVFSMIGFSRLEKRIFELECESFKLENKLYRLQHPIKVEIEPLTGRPFRDTL